MPPVIILTLFATDPAPIAFRDVSATSGVVFRFHNGSRGRHDLPEIMGGGVAMIDMDGDGHLDLYFPNGGPIVNGPDPPGALFRNKGDGTFAPVPDPPPGPPYAMGCAVGDYDGDGRDDLFVTGWRGQRLYRNDNGRFVDATARAGLSCDLWTTSAAFADLDGDGDLDLFVAAYLDYDATTAPFVAAPDGKRDYAGPEDFPAQPDRLYRNNGDGTFADVSKSASGSLTRAAEAWACSSRTSSAIHVLTSSSRTTARRIFCSRTRRLAIRGGRGCGWASHATGGARCWRRWEWRLGDVGDRRDARGRQPARPVDDRLVRCGRCRGVFEDRDVAGGFGCRDACRVTGFGLALADLDGDGDARPDPGQRPRRPRPRAIGRAVRDASHLVEERGGTLLRRLGGSRSRVCAWPILGRGLATWVMPPR